MNLNYDNIIIGAGISGLTLARGLHQQGSLSVILEKSKGVGGRLATRRDGACVYDHGAQFLKVRKNSTFVLDAVGTTSSLKHLWFSDERNDFFCSPKGMTFWAKALAQDLTVQLSEKVVQLRKYEEKWQVICESGKTYAANSVFLTAPVPQALELLTKSDLSFPQDLLEIEYAKALVGLFELEENESLKKIVYQQNCNEAIFSIANQQSKNISQNLAFTIVMQPAYSEQNFSKSDLEVLEDITYQMQKYLDTLVIVKNSQLKKWRYSHPIKKYKLEFLPLDANPGIFLLGDGFGGPQIHGACNSAQAVLNFLNV